MRRAIVALVSAALLGALLPTVAPSSVAAAPAAPVVPTAPAAPAAGDDLIAYVCQVDGRSAICTIRPDGTDRTVLTGPEMGSVFSPTWSPDGRMLAFTRGSGLVISDDNQVWVMQADGSDPRRVGQGSLPDWSPLGEITREVNLDGRGSLGSSPIASWAWDVDVEADDDPGVRGSRQSYDYPSPGRRQVSLTVIAQDGSTSVATRSVDVPLQGDRSPEPRFEVTYLGPRTVEVDASGSFAPGGDIASYEWDFSGDDAAAAAGTEVVTHTFAGSGEETIELRVTDADGRTSSVRRPAGLLTESVERQTEARFTVSAGGTGRIAALRSGSYLGTPVTKVVTMNLDGSGMREHALGHGTQEDPAWFPDGERLAFMHRRTAHSDLTQSEIQAVDSRSTGGGYTDADGTEHPAGTNLTRTSGSSNNVSEINPAISPDGSKMAYVECVPTGTQGRCRYDTTRIVVGTVGADRILSPTPLVPPKAAFQFEPAWSSDGTRLAYADFTISDDPALRGGLWVIAPDGSDRERIPNTNTRDRSPDWRPTVSPDEGPALVVVNREGVPRSLFPVGEKMSARVRNDLRTEGAELCVHLYSQRDHACDETFDVDLEDDDLDELVRPGYRRPPGFYVATLLGDDGSALGSATFRVTCLERCGGDLPQTATKSAAARYAFVMSQACPAFVMMAGYITMAHTTGQALGKGTPLTSGMTIVADIVLGELAGALIEQVIGEAFAPFPLTIENLELEQMVAGSEASTTISGNPLATSPLDYLALGVSLLCFGSVAAAEKIAADPPDPAYAEVLQPALDGTELRSGRPGDQLRAAFAESNAYGGAVLAALERFQGADLDGATEPATRQLDSLAGFMDEYGRTYDHVAEALEVFGADIPQAPATENPPLTADELDDARARQAEVAANGFDAEERQRYRDGGLSEAHIDALEQAWRDVQLPDSLATDSFRENVAAAVAAARQAAEEYRILADEVRIFRAGYNPVPILEDQSIEVPRDVPTQVTLQATDPDGAGMDFDVLDAPAHGRLSGTAPDLTYIPDAGYLGSDSFTWTASNDTGAAPPATVSIEVLLPAPEAFPDEYGTNVGATLDVPAPGVLTNDLGLALPMTAEVVDRPAKGSVVLRPDGSFTYTPRSTASGTDRFTYRARTPGSAASTPTTVTIRLVNANRPPTAVSDLLRIDEDGAGSIDVLANDLDLDGDPLVVTGIRQPRYGTVVCVASTCAYSPPADFHGVDSFTYTVSDGQGATSSGYVRVEVAPVEDPPRAVDDLVSIEPGVPAVVDVLANDFDPDGDEISFVSHSQPTNGSATCTAAGVCTYTPADVDVSADSFTYTIQDSTGREAQAQVLIANEPPMIFSQGPLELIITGNTLSCSVDYAGDVLGSFFNDVGCGTFLASAGTLYGQAFTGVGLNPPQPREIYEPLSQSRVLGTGTVDDPYRVTTRVRAGDSGLELTQVDSYVVGEESYRTDVSVQNTGADGAPVVLYRGGDCQLGDSDTGFGRVDPDSGAVACTAADGRILEWLPLTGGSTSIETDPDSFWDAIASQQPFPGTCRCDEDIDNAGGLSWAFTVAPGATVTQSHRTIFSPFGYRPITMSLSTTTPSVTPFGDVGYELTVTNPNATSPAVLDTITARLPSGFALLPGTTSGATSDEPNAVGRRLTWDGPFTVPAGGNVTLAFGATATDVPGTYLASASGTAPSFTVQGTGDTAPVEVMDAIAPVASFTAGGPALAIDFDGSASFDLDGTVVAWAWDFGDGATGSGATTTHAYAAAGTYLARLTVTDDDGATATTSRQVVARDPNQLPTARIDAATDELQAALDGTASTDPDGTVVAYRWDLGDGSAAWGPTPRHRYDAAGTYTVRLTVTDDRGGTGTTTSSVEVTQRPNVPPTAAFTTSPAGLTVGFDGRSSNDPDEADGRVASYAWDFGDGSGGIGEQPSHAYAAEGTYPVTLTVTDRRGASASTTRDVVVSESRTSNEPPLAAFTPAVDGLKVDVDGSPSTDPDGEIVAYEWEFADQGYDEGPDATFAFLEAGTYPVRLVVTDDDGASSATVLSVSVPSGEINQVPTAAFTAAVDGLRADFDGTGSSDPDGTIESWSWDFGDGTSGSGATPSHTYATGGTYQVTLTVTDDAGATDTDTQPVTVTAPPPPNRPPVADFTWNTDGLGVNVDGSASSDPDGTVVSWSWAFGDGATGAGTTAEHTYAAPGSYEVVLTVTDDDGATDEHREQVTVTVVDPPPPVNLAPVAAFSTEVSARSVAFDAAASTDPDGTIVAYLWDLGDGATATGPTPEHTYASDGTYRVTLTVTDDDGATGTATAPVTVAAPVTGVPPVAAFTAVPTGLGVAFDGRTSSDPDGTITSYAWTFGDGTGGSGATPEHAYDASGTYLVTLTVTDDDGQTDSVTVPVTVWGPVASTSAPPIADLELDVEGPRVDLDGGPSFDPDGTVVAWSWDLGDGTTTTGKTVAHTYGTGGTYDVTLVVTDDDGLTGTTTRRIEVTGPAVPVGPVAVFTYAVDGGRLTVDGSDSTGPGGGIVSWRWSFGDGPASDVSGPGAVAGHVYARSGTYPVTLVVVAADGTESTTRQDITVAVAASPAPVTPAPAPAVAPPGAVQVGEAPVSDEAAAPLPRTGSEPLPLVRWALLTLLLGLLALVLARHRARRYGVR